MNKGFRVAIGTFLLMVGGPVWADHGAIFVLDGVVDEEMIACHASRCNGERRTITIPRSRRNNTHGLLSDLIDNRCREQMRAAGITLDDVKWRCDP